ncbi:MAG: response regulator transcription factor [Mariprofundaceae bacterium]|nr:response regulator transcription factor [Mariprofundaceae bacterium]
MGNNLAEEAHHQSGTEEDSGHCRGHILVIDDDALIRQLLQAALGRQGYRVRLARNLATAQKALRGHAFDVVFVDIVYPGQQYSGFDIMDDIRKFQPGVPIVLMTAHPSAESAVEALHKHAFDYLMKPIRAGELNEVTRRALQHRMDETGRGGKGRVTEHTHDIRLTGREQDVLRLFARGLTFSETAEHLGCKPSTVHTHAKQIYKKLGVHSRSEAVFEARHLGMLDN